MVSIQELSEARLTHALAANRFPIPDPPPNFRNGHNPQIVTDVTISRPGIFLRTWTALRKLIRKRQESQAVKDARLEAAKAKRDAAKQVADIAQKMLAKDNEIKELQGRLAGKAREVAAFEESTVPRLKNEIAVLRDENKLLAALHEKHLTREKAAIAVYNQRIAGDRDPAADWQARMME